MTEVGPANRKCPPSMDQAADMAAVIRCSDELEYQDRGGKELAGCRYGLETHPRRQSGKVESPQARTPTYAHKSRCRDRETLAYNRKTNGKQTKRLPNRTEGPREPLY